jgi:hypothetical protein
MNILSDLIINVIMRAGALLNKWPALAVVIIIVIRSNVL